MLYYICSRSSKKLKIDTKEIEIQFKYFNALVICFMLVSCSNQGYDEKPIQHLKLENITSYEEATQVFAKESAFIMDQKELTDGVLHEIHMSTYSLEKAVAYFIENTVDEQQRHAKQIAFVVEEIHLASENNRFGNTQRYINRLGLLIETAEYLKPKQ